MRAIRGVGCGALELYDGMPGTVRGRLRYRWATCPFTALERLVPEEGRILEVGCGQGLFSFYLALGSPERRVRGIDIDAEKIGVARRAAARAARLGADLEFAVAGPGELPDGPWDAVAVVDVLYLMDAAAQKRLLAGCAERLVPGGSLVVKEMALRPRWKFIVNTLQETLSVRVLRITAGGDGFTFSAPSQIGVWMQEEGLLVSEASLHRGYLHPHHVVVGRRPGLSLEPEAR